MGKFKDYWKELEKELKKHNITTEHKMFFCTGGAAVLDIITEISHLTVSRAEKEKMLDDLINEMKAIMLDAAVKNLSDMKSGLFNDFDLDKLKPEDIN